MQLVVTDDITLTILDIILTGDIGLALRASARAPA